MKLLISERGRILLGVLGLAVSFHLKGLPVLFLTAALMIFVGYPVFLDALRGILRRDLLDEKFLMTVASLGAFLLGEYVEGVGVLLFFTVGEYFEHRAVARSRGSIRALMDIRPDSATVLRFGEELRVDADEVAVGETIVLVAGERIPVDCRVLSGDALVDTSAVSGESIPVRASCGRELLSGCVILDGRLTAEAIAEADDSAAARILELVEEASDNKAKQEAFITKFSRVYTPLVVGFAALFGGVLPLILALCGVGEVGALYLEYGKRALTFLVVSCPCALVISVPLSFFGGIGGAASAGILFKGGNRLSAIAHPTVVAMDKTGTLTKGEFSLLSLSPACGVEQEYLLWAAAMAEQGSRHPIALALRRAYTGEKPLSPPDALHEYAGRGVVAEFAGRAFLVGNRALLTENGVALPDSAEGTVLVAEEGRYLGALTLGDAVRPEAKEAISRLRALGVRRFVMLTGDSPAHAEGVAHALGFDECFAALLPEGKYAHVEALSEHESLLFVGDGMNDAPVLARADVGVAMGGIGSDAAIEAADAVILSDDLLHLPQAVRIARKTLRIAQENIVFALVVKLATLALIASGVFSNMWFAVFADVGVAVIAILNAMRAMHTPRSKPCLEGETNG